MPVAFSSLAGRTLFLTGATGFIGRSLLDQFERLAQSGVAFEVCGLSRDPDRFIRRWPEYADQRWLRWQRGDITTLDRLDGSFTDVIHGAADPHSAGPALAWLDQIVAGTRRVLSSALSAGAERFLLLSSGAVYGPQPVDVPALREDYPGAPDPTLSSSLYGQAKRLAEQYAVACYTDTGLIPVIARIFAVTGRHLPLDGAYAIGNFIRDARDPTVAEITVTGDGSPIRTYLHTDDLTHWLLLALCNGSAATAYNIGSDEPITIADLARRVTACAAPAKPVRMGASAQVRPDVRSRYVPDIARICALGAKLTVGLDSAIQRTVDAADGGVVRRLAI